MGGLFCTCHPQVHTGAKCHLVSEQCCPHVGEPAIRCEHQPTGEPLCHLQCHRCELLSCTLTVINPTAECRTRSNPPVHLHSIAISYSTVLIHTNSPYVLLIPVCAPYAVNHRQIVCLGRLSLSISHDLFSIIYITKPMIYFPGEGFHNYHHTFPYDYATSEFGCKLNLTTCFIDLMCVLGLAKDRRRVPTELVMARAKRTGDGSHRSG